MTCVMFQSSHIQGAPITVLPSSTQANRKKTWRALGAFVTLQSLPSDPEGYVGLTFSGIKAGSELHIYYPDGSKGASIESAVDNQQVTVQRYVTGSPFNTVRVLIASLGFENLDFSIELPAFDSSIPVFQRIDRAYRNPA